ncbi:MAG: hypothetical protein RLZZ436_3794, partial [Planctomycetota bacterium]
VATPLYPQAPARRLIAFSLLTSHFSLLTSHFSLLTSHFSLLTSHFSLLTSHFSLLTSHLAPRTSSLLSTLSALAHRPAARHESALHFSPEGDTSGAAQTGHILLSQPDRAKLGWRKQQNPECIYTHFPCACLVRTSAEFPVFLCETLCTLWWKTTTIPGQSPSSVSTASTTPD